MASQTKQTCGDTTYPLSKPEISDEGTTFKIAVVADLDQDSKHHTDDGTWVSILKNGTLTLSPGNDRAQIQFDDENAVVLKSTLAEKGRGMELSELKVFNGKLLTVDDRTGIVYEIQGDKVEQWVRLVDGDGTGDKGFKGEWMTEKDGRLYIGSLGKEWTSDDDVPVVLNNDQQWVKSIGPEGDIQHLDWKNEYNALRAKINCSLPGYIIHEAVVWSSVHKKWFFLPRRASEEHYNPKKDETRSTNIMFTVSEDFKDIQYTRIGKLDPERGFSSFKFVPGTNHQVIVALKSKEVEDVVESVVLVFNIDGTIISEEKKVGNQKYEGIEFV